MGASSKACVLLRPLPWPSVVLLRGAPSELGASSNACVLMRQHHWNMAICLRACLGIGLWANDRLMFAVHPYTLPSPVLSYVLNVQRPECALLSQCCYVPAVVIQANCKNASLKPERAQISCDAGWSPRSIITCLLIRVTIQCHVCSFMFVCWNKHAMMLSGRSNSHKHRLACSPWFVTD